MFMNWPLSCVLCVSFAIVISFSGQVGSIKFENFLNVRFKPIAVNIDTKKATLGTEKIPLYTKNIGGFRAILVNTGQSIQNTNAIFNVASLVGGPLESEYQYVAGYYYWTKDTTGVTGTTIDHEGFPYEIRILYRNIKYETIDEAVKHHDGLVETVYLYRICSTELVPFNILSKKFNQISKAGTFTFVLIGTQIKAAVSKVHLITTYYSYSGAFVDQYTNRTYQCSTVIVLNPDADYCLTKDQFTAAFSPLKNFQGGPLTNTMDRNHSYTPVSEFHLIIPIVIP